jgi:TatD DNase family protein
MKFYDAHNHLHDTRLDGLRDEVMASAIAKGIDRFVVNGTSENDWESLYVFAKEHKAVIPSFGLHPWHVAKRSKNWEEKLRYYLDKLPSGVGEVGLDKWMQGYDMKEQESVFRAQIALSVERNLPLSIHCLKAWGNLLIVASFFIRMEDPWRW